MLRRIIFLLLLLVFVGCSQFLRLGKKSPASILQEIKSYAVVYSKTDLNKLAAFDLVILDPNLYKEEEVHLLRKQNKIVLAYLNIGEIETYRSYAGLVSKDWILAANKNWQEHYFVNPAKKGWGKLLRRTVIPPIIAKGFDGFLFDSVDLASGARFPQYYRAMVRLINELHNAFPQQLILLNNGDFLLADVKKYIDGLLFEEIITRTDANMNIVLRNPEDRTAALARLNQIKMKWQLPIFILEYLPADYSTFARILSKIKKESSFIFYATDYHVQNVYKDFLPPKMKIDEKHVPRPE